MSNSPAYFFKSILWSKNWRGGGEWLLKSGTIERWLRSLTMLLPGPDLHCASPWQFRDFCDIFLPKIGKGQKKSYHLSTEPLAL